MHVKVQLFATFRDFSPQEVKGEPFSVELLNGNTLHHLLCQLRLPEQVPKILLVNGRHCKEHEELHEGDTVNIFPPLAGG